MIRRAPRSTLFPYTTLFRSLSLVRPELAFDLSAPAFVGRLFPEELVLDRGIGPDLLVEVMELLLLRHPDPRRSEEHTSELQSRQYLVCRLLLEKKNNAIRSY